MDIGYDEDRLEWGEFEKAAHRNGFNDLFGNMVDNVQSCDDWACYSEHDKFCFAGGMSSQRTKDSAFVGEVYVQGFGGIDSPCEDGWLPWIINNSIE